MYNTLHMDIDECVVTLTGIQTHGKPLNDVWDPALEDLVYSCRRDLEKCCHLLQNLPSVTVIFESILGNHLLLKSSSSPWMPQVNDFPSWKLIASTELDMLLALSSPFYIPRASSLVIPNDSRWAYIVYSISLFHI